MHKSDMLSPDNPILSTDLAKPPTLEEYRKIMEALYWNFLCRTIFELREFEVGFQAAEFLLELTDRYRSELTEKQYEIYRYILWYFYLRLLDKTDQWEELISTLEKLKQDPSIRLPIEYYPYRRSPHITDHLYWQNRRKIVQKKIDRQKQGKSVKHLIHGRSDEISDDEYQRRIESIKYWFRRAQTADERYREIFAIRKKSTEEDK